MCVHIISVFITDWRFLLDVACGKPARQRYCMQLHQFMHIHIFNKVTVA